MTVPIVTAGADDAQAWTCGSDCRYAHALRGADFGWRRCTHPQATGWVGHESLDCRRFDSRAWPERPAAAGRETPLVGRDEVDADANAFLR